jgi:acyl carrier protein
MFSAHAGQNTAKKAHIKKVHMAMSIKETVISEIEQIAEQHQKTLAPLTDDVILLDTGLDSLCFAVLVARLEDRLGVDPFSDSDDVAFPVTLGDFVRVYENAAR